MIQDDKFAGLSTNMQRMALDLADLLESSMTDEEMLSLCPDDYPSDIGDEHRNSVWSTLVDFFSELDPSELYACWASFIKDGHDTKGLVAHILQSHIISFGKLAENKQ